MANKEQLEILERGVDNWNQWREESPDVPIDLRRAKLHQRNLRGANFKRADLRKAKLTKVNLNDANLCEADLRGAVISRTKIERANLKDAVVRGTTFVGTNMDGVNFNKVKAGLGLRGFILGLDLSSILAMISGFCATKGGLSLPPWDFTRIGVILGAMIYLCWGVILGNYMRKRKNEENPVVDYKLLGILALLYPIALYMGAALAGGDNTFDRMNYFLFILWFGAAILSGIFAMLLMGLILNGSKLRIVLREILFVWAIAAGGAGAWLWRALVMKEIPSISELTLILLISVIAIPNWIEWRIYTKDPQCTSLQRLGVLYLFEGLFGEFATSFKSVNLNNANFSQANLKNTRFGDVTATRTCWHHAKYLQFARLNDTILTDRTVRELLVTNDGNGQSFTNKHLQGAYLVKARLNRADLSGANLNGATLQNANLRKTNFTEATLLGVNCRGADFTGACLKAWNIDSTTQLNGAQADYVYLLENQRERRPNSGTFAEGDFSKLIKEVLHTVDFIFKKGIDWQAFLVSFDDIRQKIRVESEEADIAVQSIENKGDGVFVVKITVSQGIDKETLHRELTKKYEQQLALQETKYRALLQGKEEVVAVYKQQTIDMKEIIKTQSQKQAINITGKEITVGDKHVGRDNIEISGSAHVEQFTTGASFQGDHAQQLLQSTTSQSSKEDILKLLSFVQQELPKLRLPEDVKEEVAHEVKGAELQLKKNEPNKEKAGQILQHATETLEKVPKLTKAAVTVGNLLGQAILWCGEQWMKWRMP